MGGTSPETAAETLGSNRSSVLGDFFETLTQTHNQATEAEQIIKDLESQKQMAVAAAAKPFELGLGQASLERSRAKSELNPEAVAQQLRKNLSGRSILVQGAAELLLGINDTNVENFSKTISGAVEGNEWDLQSWDMFASQLDEIQAFETAISSGSIPTVIFSVGWMEYRNSQAEWEGRDSSTGEYVKTLAGVYAQVGKMALGVEYGDEFLPGMLVPIQRARAITIDVTGVHTIGVNEDWGDYELVESKLDNVRFELFASGDATTETIPEGVLNIPIRYRSTTESRIPIWNYDIVAALELTEMNARQTQEVRVLEPRLCIAYGGPAIRRIVEAIDNDSDFRDDTKRAVNGWVDNKR